MKRFYFLMLIYTSLSFCMSAQIGYQVSLLNNATGEPRANEHVTVTVKITDSAGKTICNETKSETSNDFGVVSMTVGGSETFSNADWSKLPFFIEASVDGRMIGKSQLLSVPVAEHSKHTGVLTPQILSGKKIILYGDNVITFRNDGTVSYTALDDNDNEVIKVSQYEIDGNTVYVLLSKTTCWAFHYSPVSGLIRFQDD